MVVAPGQPWARITIAALPVKAAKAVSPVGAFGHMPGERGLADAGVAEQAEHLRLACLQPAADLVDRLGLLARPLARAAGRASRRRRRGDLGRIARENFPAFRRRFHRRCSVRRLRPSGLVGRRPAAAAAGFPFFGSTLAPQREQVGGLRPRS